MEALHAQTGAGARPLTPAGAAGAATNAAPAAPEDALGTPAAAAAFRLLDAALARGGGGGGGGADGGLLESLRELGALRGSGDANAVAQYSTRCALHVAGLPLGVLENL